MDFWKRAQELKDEITQNRRRIHQNAEVGLNLPNTKAFVMEKLREYGLNPTECGHGVTATLGKPGKTLLLRADMDALPMPEESGEPFACPTGETAHACGHDMHTAMLLTAAKMLKENEDALYGTVKLMFQPAEETFEGARDMLENGLLENPPVDAALAYHVAAGKSPVGFVMYNDSGVMMASVDGFEITVHGRGSHGANPNLAIDPINVGVHYSSRLAGAHRARKRPDKDVRFDNRAVYGRNRREHHPGHGRAARHHPHERQKGPRTACTPHARDGGAHGCRV